MVKEYLRRWLGIQHLSNYIVLTRKELGLSEGIATIYSVKVKKNQYKGRNHSSVDDMWPEPSNTVKNEIAEPKPDIVKGYKNGSV